MFPNLRSFSLAVAMAALVTAPGGAQPANPSDEQRCTGQAGVRPDVQAAACTSLIDSGRFAQQNLAILHSNRGIAYGKSGDYNRAIADFDAALRINPTHVRA
jgi:lipoprotein NlpI